MPTHRTGWISDVHLGTRGSQAAALLEFLRDHEFETLYLVGDLLDIWSLRRRRYWPQSHNDVIQKLLRKARKGTRLVYIPGNHDEFVAEFPGEFGNVEIAPQAVHTTADGRRILVMHGHELDTVVQNMGWLAHVGDLGYQLLLQLNRPVHWVRNRLGLAPWSLSAYVKSRVKNAVNFIGDFEEAIGRYAADHGAQAVLCGHIHTPAIRQIGKISYYNSGDWVESCTALIEDGAGRITMWRRHDEPVQVELAIEQPALAAEMV
ncbi:MAG: UDP-2,3-diacylglucosamine diphosphatase [Chthoniobacterales bacterium]